MEDRQAQRLVINAAQADLSDLSVIVDTLGGHGFDLSTDPERSDLVVTFWSKNSLLDEAVVATAAAAQRRGRLFPVRIDDVDAPIGFRQLHTTDLVNLDPVAARALTEAIRQRFDPARPVPERSRTNRFATFADVTLFIGLWLAGYFGCLVTISNITGLEIEARIHADWRLFLIASQGAFAIAFIAIASPPPILRRLKIQQPFWTWFAVSIARDLLLQTPPPLMLVLVFGSVYLTAPSLVGDVSHILIATFSACAASGVLTRWLVVGASCLLRDRWRAHD